MSIDVKTRLEALNDAWKEAPMSGGYELPPDGDYQAVVERFDFFEAQSGEGHLFLKTEMRITSGKSEGAGVSTIHNIEDPERLGWVKGHLQTLGLAEVEPFSTLEERLQEVVDVPVEIKIKTSSNKDANGNPYRNVYVNKRLGAAPAGAATGKPGKPSDDDIPF